MSRRHPANLISARDGDDDSGRDGHSGHRQWDDGRDDDDYNPRPKSFKKADAEHVYCFVPGESIDVVVLGAYLRKWIDGTATIQPGKHPRDPSRMGFNVGAMSTLSNDVLEDLIMDTRGWEDEQADREFRRNPYHYTESDTWLERRKKGPASAVKSRPLTTPRQQRADSRPSTHESAPARHQLPSQHSGDRHRDLPPPYEDGPPPTDQKHLDDRRPHRPMERDSLDANVSHRDQREERSSQSTTMGATLSMPGITIEAGYGRHRDTERKTTTNMRREPVRIGGGR